MTKLKMKYKMMCTNHDNGYFNFLFIAKIYKQIMKRNIGMQHVSATNIY